MASVPWRPLECGRSGPREGPGESFPERNLGYSCPKRVEAGSRRQHKADDRRNGRVRIRRNYQRGYGVGPHGGVLA